MSGDDATPISRRGFFKSLLPMRGEDTEQPASPGSFQPTFIWADLRTGQIGFPSGLVRNDVMPGSLIHLVAAAALLEETLVDPSEKIVCSQTQLCSNPHGEVDLASAIALGCNRYFAHASRLLTVELFLRYCADFGLNRELGKFASGEFPSKLTGSVGQFVIGIDRSFRPAAVQIIRMTAIIASGGRLPTLHSAEEKVSGAEIAPPFKETTWQFLRDAMHKSCLDGAAVDLDPKLILDPAACLNTLPFGSEYVSTMAGFFPYTKPVYAYYAAQAVASEEENAIPIAQKHLFAQPWP